MSNKGLILQHFYRTERQSEITDFNVPYVYIFGKFNNDKTFMSKTLYYPFFFIEKKDELQKEINNHNKAVIEGVKSLQSQIKEIISKFEKQIEDNVSQKSEYEKAAVKQLNSLFLENELIFINEIKSASENNKTTSKEINKLILVAAIKNIQECELSLKTKLSEEKLNELLANSLFNFDYQLEKTELKNFNKESMYKITYFKPNTLDKFAKHIKVLRYESDINLSTKFLLEQNIQSQIEIDSTPDKNNQIANQISRFEWNEFQNIDFYFTNPEIKPYEKELNMSNHITTCAVDIETLRTSEIVSISLYQNKEKIVIFNCRKPKIIKKHKFEIIEAGSEAELLNKFIDKLQELNPDILTGWAFIDFDINMIHKRMNHNNIDFNLGRVPMKPKLTINDSFLKSSTCMIPGRIVLDGITVLKDNFVKFEDYKLNTVAKEILGEEKIASGGAVEQLYAKDHDTLLEYNLIDSKLVYDIIVKKGYVDICIARSRITGMTMDKLDKSIQTLDYLYILKARERKYVVPDNMDFNKERPIEGGYVRDPITGIYDNILVFDFKSLYPSIMITLNIDKYSYLGNTDNTKTINKETIKPFDKETFFDQNVKENVIISPTGAIFSKEKAILPDLLTTLWAERDIAKREKNDVKSYAIKITMNSMYGSIASPYSRFFSLDIAGSITAFARTIIKHTAEILIEDGYEVIYGDTDSIFVNAKIKGQDENVKFGKETSDKINKMLNKLFKEKFDMNNRVELEFEKIYKKFFMPNIRGKEGGAKKRYAGLKVDIGSGKEKVDVVGLEAVRRDWTWAAKDYQLKMLDILFHNSNPKDMMIKYTKETIDKLKSGELDEKLLYKKGLKKDVSAYTKTTPPHVKAAKLLDIIESDVIEYYITENGPEPIQKLKHKIDYDHYLDKQIKPIANSILQFFGVKFDDVMKGSTQSTLFGF